MRRETALLAAWSLAAATWAGADPRTVADVLRTMGPAARARLRPHFDRAGVPYPPSRATFLVLKDERRLELWAAGASGPDRLVRGYDVLAASGGPGPKLRQGDQQVPEGLYGIALLNPNSRFHLSLKVDYPNAFDRARGRDDGRTSLGGDIFIHGSAVSIGCVAVGDPAIEELFVLAAEVGRARLRAVLAPHDFRRRPPPAETKPAWVATLYRGLAQEMRAFPSPR